MSCLALASVPSFLPHNAAIQPQPINHVHRHAQHASYYLPGAGLSNDTGIHRAEYSEVQSHTIPTWNTTNQYPGGNEGSTQLGYANDSMPLDNDFGLGQINPGLLPLNGAFPTKLTNWPPGVNSSANPGQMAGYNLAEADFGMEPHQYIVDVDLAAPMPAPPSQPDASASSILPHHVSLAATPASYNPLGVNHNPAGSMYAAFVQPGTAVSSALPRQTALAPMTASRPSSENSGGLRCPKGCPKPFSRPAEYRRHMKKHSAPEYKCCSSTCDKQFSRLDKLNDHLKVHGFRVDRLRNIIED